MTFTPAQVSIGTTPSILCIMPPGPCQVNVSCLSTTATVYIAAGSAVTTSNGYPLTSATSPVTFEGYNGSAGATLYAVSSAAATTVGWAVSTASGGTGI